MLILFGVWLIWRAFKPRESISFDRGSDLGIGDSSLDLSGQKIRDNHFSHSFAISISNLARAVMGEGDNRVHASLAFGSLKILLPERYCSACAR